MQKDTHRRALALNLDPSKIGSFAEIGAGREVARWFLAVGGASGTVAKTISAYDKNVSDSLYGPGSRYVSRQRVEATFPRSHADSNSPHRRGTCLDSEVSSSPLFLRGGELLLVLGQAAWPAAESRRSRSKAALTRARCVNAWGKLPRCWACGPSSSPYSPR